MKDLTQKRWLQIDSLFKKVLEKPPEERLTFIKYSSGSDTELKSHIEKLLQLHEEAGNIIGESAGTFAAPIVPALLDEIEDTDRDFDNPGAKVGPYDILETIGRGGMGTVYLAQKTDSPYDKKVALKLVRRGIDTADIVRRFRNEGQILASLEHPNIARLYDGGIHTDGRPWFVMEYIQGEPIDIYSDRNKFSINERLKLFRTVCEAVHFAHQSLIVHRDIKPANVLVTPEGHVKLLDFGIAKLLEPDKMELTEYRTRTGMKLMTPEFAAPEQIQSRPITTASDIYALGVLLYLLVTGRRPYLLETASMLEIERTICHKTPVRPSDAVIGKPLPAPVEAGGDTFDPQEAARLRGKNVESLKKELAGDLDRIVLMALRKEPDRRYRSALAFAEDIDSYLAGKPVQARPSTVRYRAQKFISRNRWAVSATAVALFLIFTGLGIAIWQANVAKKERDIAQQEAAKAKAAQDYLVQLFEAADPAENRGEQLTVREIVERGIARLEEDLSEQPEIHIEMLKVLGRVEQALGDFTLSAQLLEEALTKTRELRGGESLDAAAIAGMLGEVLRWNGDFKRAEALQREALEIRTRFIQGDDPEIAVNMDRLARTLEMLGNLEEAEILYRNAMGMRMRLFGENSDAVSANLNNLGWLLYQMGQLDDAEDALRRSLAIKEEIMEPPHPAIASNQSNLAVVLRTKGNYEEAEYFSTQALQQEIKLHGEDHPRVTTALNNLTLILLDLGHYEEATKNYRQILNNNRRQLGPTHLYVGFALSGLSTSLTEAGRSYEALPLLDEAIAVFRNAVGEEHRYYAMGLALRGQALNYQSPNQAVPVLEQAVNIYKQAVGESHPDFARALASLGRAQFISGHIKEAELTLKKALRIQQEVLPEPHSNTVWTLISLGQVLSDQGNFNEAERFLEEAVDFANTALPPSHWRNITARLELAFCRKNQGYGESVHTEITNILTLLEGRTDFHATQLLARVKELSNISDYTF